MLENNRNKLPAMEMVEAAILIAIIVGLGLIFKTQITNFVNEVFNKLTTSNFI